MIANAQLDNEKSSYAYQVDLLKDKLEELEETVAQLRRELREKNRESEQLKRINQRLKDELDICHAQLIERDTLIQVCIIQIIKYKQSESCYLNIFKLKTKSLQENGLVIIDDEESENEDNDIENGPRPRRRVLVSTEAAELLQNAGKGSLGTCS